MRFFWMEADTVLVEQLPIRNQPLKSSKNTEQGTCINCQSMVHYRVLDFHRQECFCPCCDWSMLRVWELPRLKPRCPKCSENWIGIGLMGKERYLEGQPGRRKMKNQICRACGYDLASAPTTAQVLEELRGL